MNAVEHRLRNWDAAERIPTPAAHRLSWRHGIATPLVAACLLLGLASVCAEQVKPFPEHWGEVPRIQTRDYVEWPAGYGHGSGTVAHWITQNIEKDKDSAAPALTVLYSADLTGVKVGELPEDFMVLNGDFTVQEENGAKFVELPGAPVESFALMFGPAGAENMQVSAKILATAKGRRFPAFAVGLNGLGGYRLKLAPGKRALELFRGSEESGASVATVPFVWESGEWVNLRLQVRKTGEAEWRVEGKAWMEGGSEPKEWMVSYTEKETPLPGRPYVAASPYSGTPIRFNGLGVTQVGE